MSEEEEENEVIYSFWTNLAIIIFPVILGLGAVWLMFDDYDTPVEEIIEEMSASERSSKYGRSKSGGRLLLILYLFGKPGLYLLYITWILMMIYISDDGIQRFKHNFPIYLAKKRAGEDTGDMLDTFVYKDYIYKRLFRWLKKKIKR